MATSKKSGRPPRVEKTLEKTGKAQRKTPTQVTTTQSEKAQKLTQRQVNATVSTKQSAPQKKSPRVSTKPPALKRSVKPATPTAEDRIEVRQSGVHGRGVFATGAIAAGERVIEYKGERISWKEALRRHPHDPNDPNHTFYFSLENGDAIDAKYDGNDARWINHACEPNCEAREKRGRVFIHALRNIAAGEELFYDYGLVIEGRLTRKLKKDFACHCGASQCRGTMLAPRD